MASPAERIQRIQLEHLLPSNSKFGTGNLQNQFIVVWLHYLHMTLVILPWSPAKLTGHVLYM